MLSRALSLAAVTLLIGCCTAGLARAQENLDAGKSPSQIFAGTCTVCHKSPRGLLKTVAPGALSGFLRQHYTTSPEMAGVLSSYLTSNGATDTRLGAGQAKDGKEKDGKEKDGKEGAKEAKSEAKPEAVPEQRDRFGHRLRPAPAEEVNAPADEAKPPRPDGEAERPIRKRLARPASAPTDVAKPEVDGLRPAQAGERGPDGHKLSAKQKLTKRSKPGVDMSPKEPLKNESVTEEPAASVLPKSDAAKADADKPESTKPESAAPEATKPAADEPPQSATIEPKETGTLRPDSVPPVTPAPPMDAASSPMSAPSSGRGSEPAVSPPPVAASSPSAVTAASPPPQPSAPAGPPVPPISQ